MVDIITDTYVMEITVIEHANVQLLSVDAPECVEYNEPFNITYNLQNNGEADICFGQLVDADTGALISNSRWEMEIPSGNTVNKVVTVPGITTAVNLRLEVGYMK